MSLSFSIIVTSYNHQNYFVQLHNMLQRQTCKDFELIFIDNYSCDFSVREIENFELEGIFVQKIYNAENLGICKAFNQGVKVSKGKYLIDLAPDDEFLPNKLEQNLKLLEESGAELLFSDCDLINEKGESIGLHSKIYPFNYTGKGNYFCHALERHRLASPTMVFSRELFDSLGGYDENLAYEDFDFISRATYETDLVYDSAVLVKKHQAPKSLSTQFRKRTSPIHNSTLQICQKLKEFCRTELERKALKSRIKLERRARFKLFRLDLIIKYSILLLSI